MPAHWNPKQDLPSCSISYQSGAVLYPNRTVTCPVWTNKMAIMDSIGTLTGVDFVAVRLDFLRELLAQRKPTASIIDPSMT